MSDALGLLTLEEAVEATLFEELATQAEGQGVVWSLCKGVMRLGDDDEVVIDLRRLAAVAIAATGGADA
jgi:hypothetical protein